MKHFLLSSLLLTVLHAGLRAAENYDVVIYGGTSAAVTAAVQVKKMGKSVVIVSPDKHLGGLSSGGLGFTDSGNTSAVGGLSREFYRRVYQKYQNDDAWRWEKKEAYSNQGQGTKAMLHDEQTMWIFEPHIAEAVFEEWVAEMDIPIVRDAWLDREKGVKKEGTRIVSIAALDGKTYAGGQFIDATYEGDLMAAAGVSYHVGREANSVYGEQNNGNQPNHPRRFHGFDKLHGVDKPVSPYKIPGRPESGLLKYAGTGETGESGTGDQYVQAYNFRLCLTNNPENRVPFPKPDHYDPQDYELLARTFESGLGMDIFALFSRIPNLKTDTNNRGPVSTDVIGENYEYPDGSYEKRAEIIENHRNYTYGWLYFIVNDPRVPEEVQKRMQNYGFAKDEFKDNGHFPYQLYVREARRMIGEYVMTEMDCRVQRQCLKPVGMGSYGLDSHNVRRYVTEDGAVQNEGDVEIGLRSPYTIDFGSIVPKAAECTNLTVPVYVSSSHIAFGSIRMEPVFMILGQSAATAAVFAIDDKVAVQEVAYDKLKERLLADSQRLIYDPGNVPVRGIAAGTLPGTVLDDIDAKLEGDWLESTAMQPFVGSRYLHDNNEEKGKKSVTFLLPVTGPGTYEVRLAYTPDGNRSKSVPVNVRLRDEPTTTYLIDQTQIPPIDKMFVSLGTVTVKPGDSKALIEVIVSNSGTTGHVVVDAVQLIK